MFDLKNAIEAVMSGGGDMQALRKAWLADLERRLAEGCAPTYTLQMLEGDIRCLQAVIDKNEAPK
jgi:hypothetical protein